MFEYSEIEGKQESKVDNLKVWWLLLFVNRI